VRDAGAHLGLPSPLGELRAGLRQVFDPVDQDRRLALEVPCQQDGRAQASIANTRLPPATSVKCRRSTATSALGM
jgi:hypothetical protein